MHRLVLVALALAVGIAAAEARDRPRGAPMPQTVRVGTPMALLQFCDANPADCRDEPGPASVALDAARRAELEAVNRAVNRAIAPRSDGEDDVWTLGAATGDCDEYTVQKRHDLMARGWPGAALLLAIAHVAGEGYHLVLVVRTDRADLVLDNLRDAILPWERTGYRWIKRSTAEGTLAWRAVHRPVPGQRAAVAVARP